MLPPPSLQVQLGDRSVRKESFIQGRPGCERAGLSAAGDNRKGYFNKDKMSGEAEPSPFQYDLFFGDRMKGYLTNSDGLLIYFLQ